MSNTVKVAKDGGITLPDKAFAWDARVDGKVGSHAWRRNEDVRVAWHQVLAQRPAPATVVNLMPYGLSQRVSNVGYVACEPCPFGQAYSKVTFKVPRMDMADKGSNNFIPQAIHPIQLAEDLTRKYGPDKTGNAYGGVFMYVGDREPSAEELAQAMAGRDRWARAQYEEATRRWAEKHDMTQITPNMRWAAKYLVSQRVFADEPEWTSTTHEEKKAVSNECDQCGELNNKAAKICKFCEYPINLEWVLRSRPDLISKFPALFPAPQVAGKGGKSSDVKKDE